MSEVVNDGLKTVDIALDPKIKHPGKLHTTAKVVIVENRGTQDVVIQPPGAANQVTVKVKNTENFYVQGTYTARYPNTYYDAFSFIFKDGDVSVTHGEGTADGASIMISIIMT